MWLYSVSNNSFESVSFPKCILKNDHDSIRCFFSLYGDRVVKNDFVRPSLNFFRDTCFSHKLLSNEEKPNMTQIFQIKNRNSFFIYLHQSSVSKGDWYSFQMAIHPLKRGCFLWQQRINGFFSLNYSVGDCILVSLKLWVRVSLSLLVSIGILIYE